jgi:hypothetical protein
MQTGPNNGSADELLDECRLFTRYLVDREPDPYVLGCYVRLQPAALDGTTPVEAPDAVLLETGRSGLIRLRLADAYARVFRPRSLLRRKLILTFAILENSAQFHSQFTSGARSSYPAALARLAASIIAFGFALTASLFVVAPPVLLSIWRSRRTGT